MMLDSEIYNKAADLIEEGWTQGAFARDKQGKHTHPCGGGAKSWCLSGALVAVACPVPKNYVPTCPVRLAEGLMLKGELNSWNDVLGRTKEQVIARLWRAADRSLMSEGE